MRIPKKLKVGGHWIKVKFANTSEIDNQGSYNNYHNLIRLEKEGDTPEDNVAETLLHEVLEVISRKNNLQIDHTHLSVVSEVLFQVLRDNKLNFYED